LLAIRKMTTNKFGMFEDILLIKVNFAFYIYNRYQSKKISCFIYSLGRSSLDKVPMLDSNIVFNKSM